MSSFLNLTILKRYAFNVHITGNFFEFTTKFILLKFCRQICFKNFSLKLPVFDMYFIYDIDIFVKYA